MKSLTNLVEAWSMCSPIHLCTCEILWAPPDPPKTLEKGNTNGGTKKNTNLKFIL